MNEKKKETRAWSHGYTRTELVCSVLFFIGAVALAVLA